MYDDLERCLQHRNRKGISGTRAKGRLALGQCKVDDAGCPHRLQILAGDATHDTDDAFELARAKFLRNVRAEPLLWANVHVLVDEDDISSALPVFWHFLQIRTDETKRNVGKALNLFDCGA
eukprot:6199967-Pleurochrysis_carterae.AAC.3